MNRVSKATAATSKHKAWAWLTKKGVRGTLNMQTGAFRVPCVVLVERKHFKKGKEAQVG
jgi:hypothetical protein